MRKVTIHGVAKQAGVSIATVSRVLNNNLSVDNETAARVQQAIRDTGYFPDTIARGMRSKKSYAIGYIVSDIANSHFTVAARAVEESIESKGYSLIVCSTGGEKEKEEKQLRLLMAKKVDGLIINVTGKNNELVCEISRQLPMVLLSRQLRTPDFHGDYVGSDNYTGAYELALHVLSHGHRRIGLIRGPENISTGSERYNGFVSALADAKITMCGEYVFMGDYYQESGRAGVAKLLSLARPPTAIVALNPAMALGVLSHIKQMGVNIPGDVSFASYGDISNRELLYVHPTMMSQNPEQEGKLAGELLIRRIADRKATPMNALVPNNLFPGESLGKVDK